jgi:hypothetical protein
MRTRQLLLVLVVAGLVSGCAFTQPRYAREDGRPIDWGLEGAVSESVTALAFGAPDERYGVYAAKRLKEELLNVAAFQRVVYAGAEPVDTRYILRGEITDLYYGGTNAATRVSLNLRLIDRADGQTRYLRKFTVSYAVKGFSLQWLNRYYAPAPLPEEVLSGLMREVAEELAERTVSNAKQCN